MLKFKRLTQDVSEIRDYFGNSEVEFCDISLGTKFMWRDEFIIDYAIINETLIMKETTAEYKDAFYYPIGKNIPLALQEIENYSLEHGLSLFFCCLDNTTVAELSEKYAFPSVFNDRNWSDYIYNAESFKTYAGKKYSGQRNHVNKFHRNFPTYIFRKVEEADLPEICNFLKAYESESDFSVTSAKIEEKNVHEYIRNFQLLNQVGGMITVNDKIVAVSFGERVKDTLIVHVEKGIKEFEGVYPTMASEFAKAYAINGVKFINREEDCGDPGLRVSKLQYQPVEIKEKNFLIAKTFFDKIIKPVIISAERVLIDDLSLKDAEKYAALYTDEEINRYYGYDYREDLNGNQPTPDYFYKFMLGLKAKKEEYSLAVRLSGELIGEIVIYNFDYSGNAEIGFRFFKEFRGKGYAFESAKAVIEYARANGLKIMKCRAFKENAASIKLITKLGFVCVSESEKQLFYQLSFDSKKQ